jgi:hypothetical protein
MRILGPIIPPSTALVAARDPEIVGGGGMWPKPGRQLLGGVAMKWTFSTPLMILVLLSKPHPIGHLRFGEPLLRVIRHRMAKCQGGALPRASDEPLPATRAGCCRAASSAPRSPRRPSRQGAASPSGARRWPRRHASHARPARPSPSKTQGRPVRVENEERDEADGAQSKASHANQAHDGPRDELAAECSTAWGSSGCRERARPRRGTGAARGAGSIG